VISAKRCSLHHTVGVEGELLTERRPFFELGRRHALRVRAKRVVVAAGSYHTPQLLDRSGVGARSGQVGRNMTLHPAFRMFARFEERVEGWRGALQSAYSRAFEREGITLVGLFVPPGVLAATMPGFGPEHVRRAADVPHLAVFGGMIHDEGGGTVRRGPGREPFVSYRMAPADKARIPRLIRVMSEIFFAAGAREVFPPILGQPGVTADELRAQAGRHRCGGSPARQRVGPLPRFGARDRRRGGCGRGARCVARERSRCELRQGPHLLGLQVAQKRARRSARCGRLGA
jgi:hypothetical protein